MFLVCYLAHDDQYLPAVQERLALASPPMAVVTARSAPEVISQAQALPVNAVIADLTWPRAVWEQFLADLHRLHPSLPVLALSPATTELEWWALADDLLLLDERSELFLHKLARANHTRGNGMPVADLPTPPAPQMSGNLSAGAASTSGLLSNQQFRQFAEIFSNMEEDTLTEAFVSWAQQACPTSRAVLLLRDPETGDFTCRAQRGLPSSLVPHCRFAQTAPLCCWLTSTSRILVKETDADYVARDVIASLDLMQAVVAVPILFDGQLVGILGLGPRLVGHSYGASELEALFALGSQIATAVHHCRINHTARAQQEMTESVLSVMPTGTIVLSEDNRIAFVNAAASTILGQTRAQLLGTDLRSLPSPLGDLAFEALCHHTNIPRRMLEICLTNRPVAVTCFALATTPPSSMLLIEDLSAQKQLEEERGRRVDLEVVTNLVHHLAHELRNPLVALSTFGDLVPTRANDPDFKIFCESVLQSEIARINLILEQLLVLTNHAEFQFGMVNLGNILERVTSTEEMRTSVVVAVPVSLPNLYGDVHRLETALTCILRTVTRLAYQNTPATMRVDMEDTDVMIYVEAPAVPGIAPEWLLNPWQQLLDGMEEHMDFGLATAQYIIEQHEGTLHVTETDNVLMIVCRLPIRLSAGDIEEGTHVAAKGTRRR
ncbi:MAG: GAF domain-containing protein [Armatimonadota bacterium]